MAPASAVARNVFVNCPFDHAYKPLFDAAIFAIHDLGFQARHALIDDGEALRLKRIADELAQSRYSIHDLSRVELSGKQKLPRFNMPFEAGIAYARHAFPAAGESHHILLIDSKRYRYLASLSDAAGLDIKVHADDPVQLIGAVREFLQRKSKKTTLQGADYIVQRYGLFLSKLPVAATAKNRTLAEMTSIGYLNDLQATMVEWIKTNPR